MEIKINQKEIYAVAKQTANVYDEYAKLLGERNPFAKFNVGAGFYVWSFPDGNWHRLSDAAPEEASEVRKLLHQRSQEVASYSNEKTAEKLFTVPSDDYIFYNLESSEPKLMLAAWAFKWPARSKGPYKDPKDAVKAHPVKIAFLFDGEKIPSYKFKVSGNGGKWIDHATDPSGVFAFTSIQAGKEITLQDQDGEEHSFIVENGVDYYEFDITRYINVRVKVYVNANPAASEAVTVSFKGQTFDGITMQDGCAVFSIPFKKDNIITSTVRDESKSINLDTENTEIVFEFQESVEDAGYSVHIAFTFEGKKIPDYNFKFKDNQGGWSDEATDGSGIYTISDVKAGEEVSLKDSEGNEHSFIAEEGKDYYEIDITQYANVSVKVYVNSKPAANEGVKLRYEDKILEGITMHDGSVVFTVPRKKDKKITARVREKSEVADLDKEDVEIIFEFQDEIKKEPEKPLHPDPPVPPVPPVEPMIKISVMRTNGLPMSYATLIMRQKGKEDYKVQLSQNGTVEVSPTTFVWGKRIDVDILDGNRKLGPVKLILDKGEYEYVLQEKDNENNKAFPWKSILCIVGLIAASVLLWHVLVGVFNALV